MRLYSGKRRVSKLLITGILLVFLITTSISVMASGDGHHHHEEEMSDHMKLMLEVKDGVPEDYQIMERVPILPTEESLQKGKALFDQNCSVCHGEKGDGKGLAASSLNPPPANFLDQEHSGIYGPGEKYWIIGNGTQKTGMPAFSQFSPSQRWHLVNHILQLQEEKQSKD